jgi:nucleotide-binding universal stress UspA family protein
MVLVPFADAARRAADRPTFRRERRIEWPKAAAPQKTGLGQEKPAMQRLKSILCVVPFESENGPVVQRAVALAANNQARLTLADAFQGLPPGPRPSVSGPSPDEINAAILAERSKHLEELASAWRPKLDIETKVLIGPLFVEIIREVLRNGEDLVIKAATGSRLTNRLFGTDDMHLLRKCPCPLWLVRPKAAESCRCILAAVDLSRDYPASELQSRAELNRQILEMAASLALSEFAQLHVVHAWEAVGEGAMRAGFIRMPDDKIDAYVEGTRKQREDALRRLISEITADTQPGTLDYLDPSVHLVKGWGRREIPALAGEIGADLLVMGTVGRTGIPGFIMGNTAETILTQIDCSVLALKPSGFVTPVSLDE